MLCLVEVVVATSQNKWSAIVDSRLMVLEHVLVVVVRVVLSGSRRVRTEKRKT